MVQYYHRELLNAYQCFARYFIFSEYNCKTETPRHHHKCMCIVYNVLYVYDVLYSVPGTLIFLRVHECTVHSMYSTVHCTRSVRTVQCTCAVYVYCIFTAVAEYLVGSIVL